MIDLRPDLLDMVLCILQDIIPEREVWAFGSRVNGTAKKFSDLDLAVHGPGPLSLSELGRLREAFSESDIPIKVDVIDFNRTDPEFQEVLRRNYVIIHPKTA